MTIEIDVGLILLLLPLNTNFSNPVDRCLPFRAKQSLEDVGSYKDCLFKKRAHYPLTNPAWEPGPMLHDHIHPGSISPYNSSVGEGQFHS